MSKQTASISTRNMSADIGIGINHQTLRVFSVIQNKVKSTGSLASPEPYCCTSISPSVGCSIYLDSLLTIAEVIRDTVG